MAQVSEKVQGYKDCLNCLIPDPIMVGDEKNLWFLEALKRSISGLILPEKSLKWIKNSFL